jgi:hypothetical protein
MTYYRSLAMLLPQAAVGQVYRLMCGRSPGHHVLAVQPKEAPWPKPDGLSPM